MTTPRLWTAAKVANHANLSKSSEQLVEQWNQANPGDLMTD